MTMTKKLTYTLAQLNPTVGDLKGNARKAEEVWSAAESDLVIFPELFLCGYPPEDLVLKPFFLDAVKASVDVLVQKSKDWSAAALLSVPWKADGKIYSALHVVHQGAIVHTQYKVHLPNYGVFDEQRIFKAGPKPEAFHFKGTTLGLMICEDMWYPDIAAKMEDMGAEMLIVSNGSPFSIDNSFNRMDIAKARVKETGLPLIYVNQVGGQDELVFDGASFVMDDSGEVIVQLSAFEENICHFDQAQRVEKSDQIPSAVAKAMADERQARDDTEVIYKAVTLGLRDYVEKNGFPGVVIGLSGGIDSALCAAIAVDALGADKVHCMMLPSPFTSQESLDDAKACAEMLGCRYDIISIEDAMTAFEGSIPDLKGVSHENMQSRTRGLILMALSNSSGAMVVSTGNKSEMAVGYATLYGDMNGGFNPLKDLYKTTVYKLAAWRNEQGAVIPERILTKAPSAELRDNQTDQDSLPPYDVLDAILHGLIEEEKGVSALEADGHDRDLILKIWALLDRAEYKRRQACPGVKISAKAFGRDRRYPMTNKFFGSLKN